MRKILLAVMISILLLGFSVGVSMADTILFPYIASGHGHVATLVSVTNTTNAVTLCADPTATMRIHYMYLTKVASATAIDACDEKDFTRPTTYGDIVTFDVSGTVGTPGGTALFNDATNYNAGFLAPNFDLPTLGQIEDRRGYLIATHYCVSPLFGNADNPAYVGDLDGEAMLIDIDNGAAWGYKAVIADPTAMGNYGFTPIGVGATPMVGMTTDLLPENMTPAIPPFAAINRYAQLQPVALYPPTEFGTSFLVTPLYIDSIAVPGGFQNDMHQSAALLQKRVRIRLTDLDAIPGFMDRDENSLTPSNTVHVRCVAKIPLATLTGAMGAGWNDMGGAAFVDLIDPLVIDDVNEGPGPMPAGDYNAIVIKHEMGAPSFSGGSMINQADLVRDGRIW